MYTNEPRKKRSFTLSRFLLLVLAVAAILYLFAGEGRALWQSNTNSGSSGQDVAVHYSASDPLVTLIPSDFSSVVEKVKPSVVRVVTRTVSTYWYRQVSSEGIGTGFIIDESGYVLTNRHVVQGVSSVTVYLSDGSSHPADIVSISSNTDVALLKIAGKGYPYINLLDPSKVVTPYQWVIAIGYPYDITGGPTVSEGIISAVGRSVQLQDGTVLNDLIQTTAATNPGNSGGPLLNLAGEMVGINTAMIQGAENIGFAVSRDAVADFTSSIVPNT